jgi:hypothetical protein
MRQETCSMTACIRIVSTQKTRLPMSIPSQCRQMSSLRAAPIAALCLGFAFAGSPTKSTPLPEMSSQQSNDKKKQLAENAEPVLPSPEKPISCENFREFADEAILRWHKIEGTHLIIIVRPGEGEKTGALSRTRLRKIETYLMQRYEGRVAYVLAEGPQVQGSGRVEFYVGGKLLAVIPVKKNAGTVCSGKVNPFS